MSKRIYNVVRPREGRDGQTYWDRHGALIVDGDKISLHLDSIPAGDWNGWFNVFPREERNAQGDSQGYRQAKGRGQGGFFPQGQRPHSPPPADFDDDIPF